MRIQNITAVLAFSSTLACLPTTNPYDPNAPIDAQAKAIVDGEVVCAIGGNPTGVVVSVYSERPGTAAAAPISQITVDEEGTFRFPTLTPGSYWVRATIDGAETAVVGPIDLAAGQALDLGKVRLDAATPSAQVSGALVTTTGGSVAGAKVVAIAAATDTPCSTDYGSCIVAETTTGPNGAYILPLLPAGSYRVIALLAGASVGAALVELEEDDVVTGVNLSVDSAAGFISFQQAGAPIVATRERTIDIVIGDLWPAAVEMRLSEDPTFQTGTGWIPYSSSTPYTITGDPGNVSIYVQLKNRCLESLLYATSIVFDPDAPALFALSLGGVSALAADGPVVVVVGDAQNTVSLAIDAIDASGVAVDVFDISGGGAPVPVLSSSLVGEGIVPFRAELAVPSEEGEYAFLVEIRDLAGNVYEPTVPVVFEVIRDFSPPTTPIPAVKKMEIYGDTAYIWLEERECDDGPPALVCEKNVPEFDFFEVRGGLLPTFIAFDQPPFAVPVPRDDVSDIEIRAVDKAGNASESIGIVKVTQVSTRTIFEAPSGWTLSPPQNPTLVGTSGTALFVVEPKNLAQVPAQYEYMMAQPSDLPSLPVEAVNPILPQAVRKLSEGCTFALSSPCQANVIPDTHYRQAYGLSSGPGRFSWVEYEGYFDAVRPSVFISYLNQDGRFAIQDENQIQFDPEGDPARRMFFPGSSPQQSPECLTSSRTPCAQTNAWQKQPARPSLEIASSDDTLYLNAVGTTGTTIDGPVESVRTVVGPAFVGMAVETALSDPYNGPYLWEASYAVDAPIGSDLYHVVYGFQTGASEYTSDFSSLDFTSWKPSTGTGYETFQDGDYSIGDVENGGLVGILVPEGVTAEFTFVQVLVDDGDGGVADGGAGTSFVSQVDFNEYRANGIAIIPLASNSAFSTIDESAFNSAFEPGIFMRSELHISIPFDDKNPIVSGFIRHEISRTGTPTQSSLPFDLGGGLSTPGTTKNMLEVPTTEVAFATAEDVTLSTPERDCMTVLEVTEPTQVRNMVVHGQGRLDELMLRFYRKDLGEVLGPYAPYNALAPFSNTNYAALDTSSGPDCQDSVLATPASDAQSTTMSGNLLETITGSAAYVNNSVPAAEGNVDVGNYEFHEVPVTPGSYIVVRFDGGANPTANSDPDFYVKFGDDPTPGDNDCASEQPGSEFEYSCILSVPAFESALHVGVYGYAGDGGVASYRVTIVEPLVEVESVFLNEGETLIVTTEGDGDIDVLVDYDGELDVNDWYCSSVYEGTSDERCTVSAPLGGGTVIVGYYIFDDASNVTHTLERGVPPAPIVLGPLTVSDGLAAIATVNSSVPEATELYVKFNEAPTTTSYDCSDVWDPLACEIFADDGDTSVYVAVHYNGIAPADIDVGARVEDRGCTAVRAAGGAAGSLVPGLYLISLSSADEFTEWPGAAPLVERGPPLSTSGAVRVVGNVSNEEHAFSQQEVTVLGVNPTQHVCSIEIVTETVARFEQLTAHPGGFVAVESTESAVGASQRAIRNFDQQGTITRSFEVATTEVFEVSIVDGFVRWAEGDKGGSEFALKEANLLDINEEPCVIADLAATGNNFENVRVDIDQHSFVVAGRTINGNTVQRHRIIPSATECATLEFEGEWFLDDAPIAMSHSGADSFVWAEGVGTDESLVHIDHRDFVPLIGGGGFEVVSYSARPDGVDVVLQTRSGSIERRFLTLTELPGEPDLYTTTIWTAQTDVVEVVYIDNERRVLLTSGASGFHIEVLDGETRTLVASADELVAGLSESSAADRYRANRRRVLTIDNGTLLVNGVDSDGTASLALFNILDLIAAPSTTSPTLGPVTLEGDPVSLRHNSTSILVRLASDAHQLIRESETTDFVFDAPIVPLALTPDGVLVAERPSLLVTKPLVDVVEMSVAELIDLNTTVPLPSALPGTSFARIPDGLASHVLHVFDIDTTNRTLWLLDGEEDVSVTWKISPFNAVVVDGPHRPMTKDVLPILGKAATPSNNDDELFVLRRVNGNNQLWRLRLND